MDAPSLRLDTYTVPFGVEKQIPVLFDNDGGRVRSVELEAIHGVPTKCYLTLDGDNVLLNVAAISGSESKSYERIAIRFVVGYLAMTAEEIAVYTDEELESFDDELEYYSIDVDLYAVAEDPEITYIDNVASRVDETAAVTVYGNNITRGLGITLTNGEDEYIITPDNIMYEPKDADMPTSATFTIYPGMLAKNADGTEPCAQYNIYFSYGKRRYGLDSLGIIRYKYDADNDSQQRYSTESVTVEKACYKTGSMTLVYDTVDANGNAVKNAESNTRSGDDIVLHVDSYNVDDVEHKFDFLVDRYGLTVTLPDDTVVKLHEYELVELNDQDNWNDNGYWRVKQGAWKHVYDCSDYSVIPVKLKYNQNLSHKNGKLRLNGVKLDIGDIVWLANQTIESENGLWIVQDGDWLGYDALGRGNEGSGCGVNCYRAPIPKPVDDSVLVDLGAKATYPVDYVCRNPVPYKCGSRTICNYRVVPGNVVALLNTGDGTDGIYLVTCGDWVKMYDITEDDLHGTTVDLSRYVIVQNDIDFCKCGGLFHIDYYFLTPSCYMHHLCRTVKILCGNASIAPNDAEHQFSITEYKITVGEEDALIGNRGRTPGDPVKETCAVDTEDFDVDFGLSLIEHRQYVENPRCITTPMGNQVCDMPRIYNLRMTSGYSNSNDRSGFTIKFWRLEDDGWHLYAYVASGTQKTGMDYYVYHLFVNGKATETLVDVNEHDWFSETTGVIAGGYAGESFGICDDTWEFVVDYDEDDKPVVRYGLDSETLYMPWRISCTTNLFAHSYPHSTLRTTCADMEVGWKTVQAIGDEEEPGYLRGMPHLFGVAYYTTTMSKSQFVAEYNQYDPAYIGYKAYEVLVTDDDTEDIDENPIGQAAIATDDSTDTIHRILRI